MSNNENTIDNDNVRAITSLVCSLLLGKYINNITINIE